MREETERHALNYMSALRIKILTDLRYSFMDNGEPLSRIFSKTKICIPHIV